jgi:glutathione S-transferase
LRDGGGVPLALAERTHIARVPTLQHGDLYLTESSAIVEYLDEQFEGPRLFPADPIARAKARQWMAFVRADLLALRTERSWWMCVYPPESELPPMSRDCERDTKELLDLVGWLWDTGELAEWNIAQADLALTLMRLARTGHTLPDRVQQFLDAQLARPSMRVYLDHTRPPHKPPRSFAEG